VFYKKWSFHVYSDGWRHFLVCISSASERKETWINVHPFLDHLVSENFVSWCQTLKNSSASFLCIQETYSPRSRNLKVIKKMCILHLKCICVWSQYLDVLSGEIEKNLYWFYTDFSLFRQIKRQDTVVWCLDNWFYQVSLLTHFPWHC
jgi:hypothetical protein